MSAAQVAGQVLSFPSGATIAQAPTPDVLLDQARELHRMGRMVGFNATIALVRGDADAAVKALVHERGKLDQALALTKEARGLPRGKRAIELAALQLVLGAVNDELGFLPGVTDDDTANALEAAAERLDNAQARLLTMAEGYRSNATATATTARDESPE